MGNLQQNRLIMNLKTALLFTAIFSLVACNTKDKNKSALEGTQKKASSQAFEFSTWITSDKEKSTDLYAAEFKKYKDHGIDEILINTLTDPKELERLVPIAKAAGLNVHAWIMTMNRPGDSEALQHPEWYAVSKDGNSCYDTRPYVDYYQWLCPNREESRNHILGLIEALAKVEGIESVHLDYIRFSDIFLPIALLPKYNLVQDTELPEFDFCYCEVCISKFEDIHHKNPLKSRNTSIDMEWKNFRLNSIKNIVDDAYGIAKENNKKLTAAVFPYPEMADHRVRQRWDKWNIDEVYPMIYHGFYSEEVDWIGYATQQGVSDVKSKNIAINTGVYIPDFNSTEELKQSIKLAKENGAKGVAFYEGKTLTDAYLQTIKEVKAELK
jgi:uncharacterized lipoprotein YddW (UPF0748 family)